MHKKYGLIGFPLSHSFSPGYFKNKFEQENIEDCSYQNYEISSIDKLSELLDDPTVAGLNITIPYKETAINFIDELSEEASKIGAINTIKFKHGKSIGYNTDVYGFELSLLEFLDGQTISKALILGTGGAAKAVSYVLTQLDVDYDFVSRTNKGHLSYDALKGRLPEYQLLVNTTPVGMSPKVDNCPNIPYDEITSHHFFYDLIYNPEKTLFLERAENKGAKVLNGHRMLVLQAKRSWEIWND